MALRWGLMWLLLWLMTATDANPDAKRLYDDLLSNYNRLIRPVGNNSDRLTVKMGLKLSQLIDVNLKNQIMTTNVWVEQEWNDYKLKWNPDDYGGVETLHVPSEHIWLPDIVLYNNADGNYEVTIMTKAILHHTGRVVWKPPAVYKSFCEIDVEYFPFDEQTCFMKFGSWTYDGYMVDLRHLSQDQDSNKIDIGIDLQDYYISVEWDIMKVPAVRNEKFYSCCEEPYPDIIFNITLRRKTLFYTVNLIIPCVGISFLSILVFYLPSDSGEKVSLCISILLSLTVFFLLLVEIIPPTSITVPLLGKYLLFTMLLCTLSVVVTIAVLNVNFRSPVTHKLAPWVKIFFIGWLPKFLFIERPQKDGSDDDEDEDGDGNGGGGDTDTDDKATDSLLTDVIHVPSMLDKCGKMSGASGGIGSLGSLGGVGSFDTTFGLPPPPPLSLLGGSRFDLTLSGSGPGPAGSAGPCFGEPPFPPLPLSGGGDEDLYSPGSCCGGASGMGGGGGDGSGPECCGDGSPTYEHKVGGGGGGSLLPHDMEKTVADSRFIAQHVKNKDKFESVEEDWKYVAMVLDRLFLWIFTGACIVGTCMIILKAPSLYDHTKPIDILISKVAKRKMELLRMVPEEL